MIYRSLQEKLGSSVSPSQEIKPSLYTNEKIISIEKPFIRILNIE